jgi:hypothetical protein
LSVEVQHSQETAELTGDFGRVVALKMGYQFFQRFGTLGRNLVTKEIELR